MREEKASMSLAKSRISFLAAPRSRASRFIDLASLRAWSATPAMATMLAASPRISAMIIVESGLCHSCREEIYRLLVDEAALYFPHIALNPHIPPHFPLHATMLKRGCEEDYKTRGRLSKSPISPHACGVTFCGA
jgi:hypothetical protein